MTPVVNEYFYMTNQGMEEVPKLIVWRISENGQITMIISLVLDKFQLKITHWMDLAHFFEDKIGSEEECWGRRSAQ